MSDAELSISELRRKRAQAAGGGIDVETAPSSDEAGAIDTAVIETAPRSMSSPSRPTHRQSARHAPQPEPEPSFDRSRFVSAIKRSWHWILLALAAGAAIGGAIGFARGNYSLLATLTLRDLAARFDGPDGVSYKPPRPSSQAMINFLTSAQLLYAVASQANPPISERDLLQQLDVNPEKGSENIEVTITGKDPQKLIDLANLYTGTAVALSKEAQQEDPGVMYTNLTQQLAEIERQQTNLNQRFMALRTNSGIADPAIENPAFEKEWVDLRVKIDLAQGELASLKHKARVVENEPLQRRLQDANAQLLTYRSQGKLDEHPDVKRLLNEIADLNRKLSGDGSQETLIQGPVGQLPTVDRDRSALQTQIQQLQSQADAVKAKLDKLFANAGEYNQLKSELDRLDIYKKMLNNRRFEAQQYRDVAEGYFHPPSALASMKDIDPAARYRAAGGGAGRGGALGLILSLGLVLLVEYADPRLKTAADVKRVTDLPVLATLGDLNKMNDEARKAWAFRTWTILSGTLATSANRGTVCGFISCAHGEGRSTWVEMLVGAAKERGFEVIKLDFNDAHLAEHLSSAANGTYDSASPSRHHVTDDAPAAYSSALAVPSRNQSLAQSRQPSVIHIELPGLVWDLDRRIQFQTELEQWQSVSRSVILVDLPPASVPEAVLLAENLPQLIWLVDAGKSHARETRLHLETLRHARCKLVGAVLNHEPEPLINL
jgi:uncharacterized protein involved in exopolysaccharide biosynthesis